MRVKRIELFNYRNYLSDTIEFSDGLNVIAGHNAQGKTNQQFIFARLEKVLEQQEKKKL